MRSEQASARSSLQAGASIAGGRRCGRGGRAIGGRSRRRSLRGANTVTMSVGGVLMHGACMWDAYLASKEYGAYTVEQLERRDDVALHQDRGAESCRHPPACTHGHLVEPLFERESTHHATVPALQRLCHGCGIDN